MTVFPRTLNKETLLNALAYYTRLNFLPGGSEATLPIPEATVCIRAAMATAYAICGGLISWLVPGDATGRVAAAILVIALHFFVTAGREFKRPLIFLPMPADEESDDLRHGIATIALLIPSLLTFLLILSCGCYWLIPVMALGSACGCEMSAVRANTPLALEQPCCWIIAGIITICTLLIGACFGGFIAFRGTLLRAVLLAVLLFIATPWLRGQKWRPAGRANNVFIGEFAALALAIIFCIFNA